MWCIPKVDAEFVARMEDVLALYAEPPDPRRARRLLRRDAATADRRSARPDRRPNPGRRARFDYEYVRNGTANVFMFVDVNRPWRHAKVTDRRRASTSPSACATSSTMHYPDAERIRVVLDNLSTHSAGGCSTNASRPPRRAASSSRLEFHFTPKHASWLNMVEIEIGVMVVPVPGPTHPDKATLVREVKAWERRRNAEKAQHQVDVHGRARAGEARPGLPHPARNQPVQAAA